MLKPLTIKATKQTPDVALDYESGILKFEGKSRPEDAMYFYEPILTWINRYVENPQPKTRVIINLEYYNSATAKVLKSFFEMFHKLTDAGFELALEWHYQEEDEDMREVGEELSSLFDIPFIYKPY